MTPQFHSPGEAAKLLGVSVRTLRRAVIAGDLACVRYNPRVWRLRADHLAAWYQSKGGELSASRSTRASLADS